MLIRTVRVRNFKSFADVEVSLNRFNLLIGPNASGKSNFISIFRFLRDIVRHGLDNAISMQTGAEYVRNTIIGPSKPLAITLSLSPESFGNFIPLLMREHTRGSKIIPRVEEVTYDFAIDFKRKGTGFKVSRETINFKVAFDDVKNGKSGTPSVPLGTREFRLTRDGRRIELKGEFPPEFVTKKQTRATRIPKFLTHGLFGTPKPTTLFLETFLFAPFLWSSDGYEKWLANVSTYDIDPRLPKKAMPISGKMELEEDGSNLAIVLKAILESRDKKRKFKNLMNYLLQFVNDFRIEKFSDKSLLLTLSETYNVGKYLPASCISDGTVNIAALIVVLFFEKKSFIILEEPDRNLHPALISKMARMIQEASEKKQIIVTTHNAELVKYVRPEDLLLVSRNKEGFSEISRAAEKQAVRTFLENEIGLDEIFSRNIWGA